MPSTSSSTGSSSRLLDETAQAHQEALDAIESARREAARGEQVASLTALRRAAAHVRQEVPTATDFGTLIHDFYRDGPDGQYICRARTPDGHWHDLQDPFTEMSLSRSTARTWRPMTRDTPVGVTARRTAARGDCNHVFPIKTLLAGREIAETEDDLHDPEIFRSVLVRETALALAPIPVIEQRWVGPYSLVVTAKPSRGFQRALCEVIDQVVAGALIDGAEVVAVERMRRGLGDLLTVGCEWQKADADDKAREGS